MNNKNKTPSYFTTISLAAFISLMYLASVKYNRGADMRNEKQENKKEIESLKKSILDNHQKTLFYGEAVYIMKQKDVDIKRLNEIQRNLHVMDSIKNARTK